MPYVRRRRGMGDATGNFLCSIGLLAPSSASCQSMPATRSVPPPVLPPGSTSPGLPAGYDPNTGTISGNPTGETVPNSYLPAYPDLSQYDSNGNPLPPANWLCTNLGLFCGGTPSGFLGIPGWGWAVGLTLGGVVALGVIGGRR